VKEDYDNTDSMYRRYKNETEIKWMFRSKNILSFVAINIEDALKFYVILKGKRKMLLTQTGTAQRSGGDWYFHTELQDMSYFEEEEHKGIIDYGLLLPMPESRCRNQDESMWTMVFSDWSVLSPEKGIMVPRMNSIRYTN